MRKSGGRRRVGQVVRRHIYTLHGRNGAFIGGGDALLQLSQIHSQCRLITDC